MSARLTRILIPIIAVMFVSHHAAAKVLLTWTAPTHDVIGDPIDPTATLEYKLYARVDSPSSNFFPYLTAQNSPMDLSNARAGCYELYLTAIRTDVTPVLESDPSESIVACINLACGETGTDGSIGYCDDTEMNIVIPGPPTSVEIITNEPM